jgi:hypothetical protein
MKSVVQNLVVVESGQELIAEADFLVHHIKVRCVYDAQHWCWVYHVSVFDDTGERLVSGSPSRLRTSSRMGAVNMGMKYAVNHLLGVKQPSLMLMIESKSNNDTSSSDDVAMHSTWAKASGSAITLESGPSRD